jgi:hypothetical protein
MLRDKSAYERAKIGSSPLIVTANDTWDKLPDPAGVVSMRDEKGCVDWGRYCD